MKVVNEEKRNFLKKVIKFSPALAGGALFFSFVKYANFNEQKEIYMSINIDELDNKVIKKSNILLLKNKDKYLAFDARCTHMGCILNIDYKNLKFVCPCHRSEFNFKGERLKGPAEKNLIELKVEQKNKILYIGQK